MASSWPTCAKKNCSIEADAYSPLAPGAEPPKVPNPQAVNLEANVRRLSLEVDRIVAVHRTGRSL